jgi:DHA3 family macrolide efflux protein-like MFS transporter
MSDTSHAASPTRWQIPFFTIWTGQALSTLGSRIAMFALIWWLTATTGSATVLALATLFATLPLVFLGPVAGVLIDRWNRRAVMIVSDGLIAILSLWIAVLFWTGAIQVWHVYLLMLAREIGGAFHWPAMQATTSLMVPKQHLARVNGVNQALNGGLNIVGPAVGALLLSVTTLGNIMLLDVITALLAIVPLLFVAVPQPPRAEQAQGGSLWSELREGARYVLGWRGLLILTGVAMLFKIALTPAFSLLPILVTQHFGGAAGELAGMESAYGIGVIAGGLLLGVWGGFRRRILTTMLGLAIAGLTILLLGLLPAGQLGAALGIILVCGVALALTDGPLFAVLQSTIAPEMQGRVLMLFASLVTLTSPIGLLIAGPITDAIGVQVWYLTAGAMCIAAGIAGFFVPAVKHIEDYGKAAASQPVPDSSTLSPLPRGGELEEVV